jgi:hypothetical protein
MMGSSIVRGLIAGAVLLSLAGVTAAVGVLEVSDLAAGGTIVTLLLLLGLVLFDKSWESADAATDAEAQPESVTPAA